MKMYLAKTLINIPTERVLMNKKTGELCVLTRHLTFMDCTLLTNRYIFLHVNEKDFISSWNSNDYENLGIL